MEPVKTYVFFGYKTDGLYYCYQCNEPRNRSGQIKRRSIFSSKKIAETLVKTSQELGKPLELIWEKPEDLEDKLDASGSIRGFEVFYNISQGDKIAITEAFKKAIKK